MPVQIITARCVCQTCSVKKGNINNGSAIPRVGPVFPSGAACLFAITVLAGHWFKDSILLISIFQQRYQETEGWGGGAEGWGVGGGGVGEVQNYSELRTLLYKD